MSVHSTKNVVHEPIFFCTERFRSGEFLSWAAYLLELPHSAMNSITNSPTGAMNGRAISNTLRYPARVFTILQRDCGLVGLNSHVRFVGFQAHAMMLSWGSVSFDYICPTPVIDTPFESTSFRVIAFFLPQSSAHDPLHILFPLPSIIRQRLPRPQSPFRPFQLSPPRDYNHEAIPVMRFQLLQQRNPALSAIAVDSARRSFHSLRP